MNNDIDINIPTITKITFVRNEDGTYKPIIYRNPSEMQLKGEN